MPNRSPQLHRRASRRQLSPSQVADRQLARGNISASQHHRLKERIALAECSHRWAVDIWEGRDRDYLGQFTGHGLRKVQCHKCHRWVPPQDVVRAIDRKNRRQHPPLCTDCRTIAPPDRTPKQPGDNQTLRFIEYLGDGKAQEWLPADPLNDSSPLGEVLLGMSASNQQLQEDALPADDEPTLREAIALYNATGELSDFLHHTGDRDTASIQRLRHCAQTRVSV